VLESWRKQSNAPYRWWIKNERDQVVEMVSALCSIQCFDTDGW